MLVTLARGAVRGAILLAVPAVLGAQGATGVVSGRVVARPAAADTGADVPAVGAAVTIAGRTLGSTAGADGRFVIARVPAGSATVRVRLLGYRAAEREVRVPAGDTVRVEIVLRPEAQRLAPVRADARSPEAEAFVSRPNVGVLTMGATAMAGVPSVGEPDVVRVVQLLPGVTARNDFNTGLNVRGGEADQNLVLLDGHPIYNPFHFGGVFSTFMDATVGGIELLTGAFPARYGGRLSSVLDVRSAEDSRPGLHVTSDLSALGASARLSGGWAGGRGTWSLAGRRTYADAATRAFTNNVFPYHFRDFHGHAAYALTPSVRLAVTGYAGRDVLDADLAEFDTDSAPSRASAGMWAFDWGNRVIGASLSKELAPGRFSRGATLEQRVSASGFSTTLDLGGGAFTQSNSIRDVRVAGGVSLRGASHEASLGYEVASHRVRYASGTPQTGTSEFDFVQRPVVAAVWVGDLWQLSPRWLVEGGLRAEALSGRDYAALSPRASVKFFVTPDFALTAGAGRVTQFLHSLAGDGPLRYFDVWLASDELTPVAAAWHGVAGAEKRLGDAGSVRVEGYVKRYDRVLEANLSEDPQLRGDEFRMARGRSYGADVIARWHPRAGPGGWVAYSYGLSRREREGQSWAPGHDRRHDLDVVSTWRLARYRLGARFGYASGTPYTPIIGEIARRVYDPSRDSWGTGDPRIFIESLGGARNAARYPATHRLDLDAARDFRVRAATVSPYVSVANAYYAKNVFVYLYEYSTERPTRRAISQFPVLPSVGVRVAF